MRPRRIRTRGALLLSVRDRPRRYLEGFEPTHRRSSTVGFGGCGDHPAGCLPNQPRIGRPGVRGGAAVDPSGEVPKVWRSSRRRRDGTFPRPWPSPGLPVRDPELAAAAGNGSSMAELPSRSALPGGPPGPRGAEGEPCRPVEPVGGKARVNPAGRSSVAVDGSQSSGPRPGRLRQSDGGGRPSVERWTQGVRPARTEWSSLLPDQERAPSPRGQRPLDADAGHQLTIAGGVHRLGVEPRKGSLLASSEEAAARGTGTRSTGRAIQQEYDGTWGSLGGLVVPRMSGHGLDFALTLGPRPSEIEEGFHRQ